MSNALLNLLESVLGRGIMRSRGNYAFHCPNCNHHKSKLEINLTITENNLNPWECWVCGAKSGFKGRNILSLFKKLKVDSNKYEQLRYIVKYSTPVTSQPKDSIYLPKEFKSLNNISKKNIIGRHAISYLNKRGISHQDIIKYNIGYCDEGLYANRIIIPSYDENGLLNYFSARTFDKNEKNKYQNPSVEKDNIIAFDLYINWELPIILVEGMFDAITIKRNVIPLLGKTLSKSLIKKIIESGTPKIYISLDTDAYKESLIYCKQFMEYGKEVYLVENKNKDASEIGFENFSHILYNTPQLTESELMKKIIKYN